MDEEKSVHDALEKLRNVEQQRKEQRKFDQTLDLIINLKEFDVRRQAFTVFVSLPKQFKEKKIAAFFEKDSNVVTVIKKDNFGAYKDKKDIKKLLKSYDNFIANAKLMPIIATSFGRVLGPAGKMPNPQMGIVSQEDEETVKSVLKRVNSTVKVAVKEPSIKVGIGKMSLKNEDLTENILTAYHKIIETLPRGKDNVRNVKIKFTMSKPIAIAF